MFNPQPLRRIVVQDRQRLFRDGLALVLHSEPGFEVIATAATAADLVAVAAEHDFDLVILELDAADWDPNSLIGKLRRANPNLTVVGTQATGVADAFAARRAGVRAVFPRSAGIQALLDTVRSVPTGLPMPAPRHNLCLHQRRPLLTDREREVLCAIGTGATTRGVAASMGISPKTVENHKQRIFSKLGVQNQAHAVSVGLHQGLVSPLDAGSAVLATGFAPTRPRAVR